MARPQLEIGTWGEVSFKKNAAGNWVARCRVRDTDGETRQAEASAKTKDAARRALLAKLKTRFLATVGTVKPDTTVRQLGQLWLASREKSGTLEDASLEMYEREVDRVAGRIGSVRLREVTVPMCDTLVLDLHAESEAMAIRVRGVLRQMMGYAVRQGAIAANPAADLERLKRTKKEVHVFDLGQVATVRQAVSGWMDRKRPGPKTRDLDDIVDLLLGTGCRIGEALAIRWCDIDLATGTVTICGTVKRERKKGGVSGKLYRKPAPKNDASWRKAQLPGFVMDMLHKRAAYSNTKSEDPVFSTRTGNWCDPRNVSRTWRAVRAELDMDWAVLHTFRKTVGTVVDEASGGDTTTASKTLGHGSEQTTKNHYLAKAKQSPDVRNILDTAFAPQDEGNDEEGAA